MQSSTTDQATSRGRRFPSRASSTTPTPSSASTRSRSAAPTCTSSRVTSRPSPPVGSSATKRSAPIESVGSGVKTRKVGDRVLVSCITACGTCRYCREGMYGQCLGGGGWILGHKIDGTQAEYVRVPFADTSTYLAPAGVSDEQLLMLADILPTGYEVGVLNGTVQPGDVVAVVGAGPIGLSAIMGARLFNASHIIAIDLADSRLEAAKQFGADVTVNNGREDPLGSRSWLDRRARRRRRRSRRSACRPRSSSPPR